MTNVVAPLSDKNEDLHTTSIDTCRAIQDLYTKNTTTNSYNQTDLDSSLDGLELGTIVYNTDKHSLGYVYLDTASNQKKIKDV